MSRVAIENLSGVELDMAFAKVAMKAKVVGDVVAYPRFFMADRKVSAPDQISTDAGFSKMVDFISRTKGYDVVVKAGNGDWRVSVEKLQGGIELSTEMKGATKSEALCRAFLKASADQSMVEFSADEDRLMDSVGGRNQDTQDSADDDNPVYERARG